MLCLLSLPTVSFADVFVFKGGDIEVAANWVNTSNGNTTGTMPGKGDLGTISVNSRVVASRNNGSRAPNTVTGFDFSTVTQIKGVMNANSFNFKNKDATFNLIGGVLNTTNLNANECTMNLMGGVLNFSTTIFVNYGVLNIGGDVVVKTKNCLLYTSPSPRDRG